MRDVGVTTVTSSNKLQLDARAKRHNDPRLPKLKRPLYNRDPFRPVIHTDSHMKRPQSL